MKKRIAALLALLLCLCLSPLVSAERVEAEMAELYVTLTPVENADGNVALEIDLEITNGTEEQYISGLEFRYENALIASIDRVYGGSTAWARSAPLGMSLASMAQEMEIEVGYTDFNGMNLTRSAFVSAQAAAPRFDFKRTASKTVLAAGEKVKLSYILKNDGSVTLKDVVISDDMTGVGEVGRIDLLFPGDMREFTKEVSITADTVSQPYVTYCTTQSDMQSTLMLERLSIVVSNPQLGVTLKSDVPFAQPGDSVTLVCSVVNQGNVTFDNVTISDPTLGTIIEGARIEAGKAYSWNKVIKPVSSGSYMFTVRALDASGAIYTANSNIVSVEVSAQETVEEETFGVSVTANTNEMTAPGEVTFNFLVRSAEPAALVIIYDAAGNVLTQLENLEAGDKMAPVPIKIEQSGDYIFTVDATLASGARTQRTTEPVHIEIVPAQPTQTPLSTTIVETPPPTPPPSNLLPAVDPRGALTPIILMLIIFVSLLIVACLVVLALLLLRAARRRREEEELEEEQAQYLPPQESRRRQPQHDPYEMRDEISRAARQYSRPVPADEEDDEEEDERPTVYQARIPDEPITRRDK